jgi:D-glucosaminate-6-phosphate ammonia-lyase
MGIYESLGIRPLINARGGVTVISGSLPLPEVKAAMDAASRQFVHIDELMEAVGRRLAELTGAPWGIVTTGAAGGLTLATCACVAGADPDKLELLPCDGRIERDEVIIPKSSRNAYDHSVRTVGVRVLEPESVEQLRAMLGPRTAMIMLHAAAGDYAAVAPDVASIARSTGVPLLVDAAAEGLRRPDPYLALGADLVCYSGGKCLRGPQCAGLLLGREDLVRAAWMHSSPHHTIYRALKVGKEEILGMVAAVEAWFKRDHEAERRLWEGWLREIADSVERIEGVGTKLVPGNVSPRLIVTWDRNGIDLTEDELEQRLFEGDPRIAAGGAGSFLPFPPDEGNSVVIVPYQMSPQDAVGVAARLYEELSRAPKPGARAKPAEPYADLTGAWDVALTFVCGSGECRLTLRQTGDRVSGAHYGFAAERTVCGFVEGHRVLLRSSCVEHGARLNYTFRGEVTGDAMSGAVLLGEYGEATFLARRVSQD